MSDIPSDDIIEKLGLSDKGGYYRLDKEKGQIDAYITLEDLKKIVAWMENKNE